MKTTTAMLRAEARVVPLTASPDRLAEVLDALAGYETLALTSIAAMMGDDQPAELRTAICTAQDAADLSACTRRLLSRNTPASGLVVRSALETTIVALDRSARVCGRLAERPHCRMQAEAAAETAGRCRRLRTQLR
ncbi:hypothetical protein GB931_13155 [Modestobacter sp. I12A-02628]|uniref:Uncharacterized protein n=1 Tax=Goekera deserti TaxID=2497753 RepID=A0A7K3W9Y8_9ACTN|nr:hypothetical protein [Goekera deserti]MPQ98850.1 hypothetical protein [Goekera deserti]NDI49651.1 hypothetical protein [Goekera deserti]NEL53156.1 hypothetical protein [Goekera deserti]